MVGAQPSPRCGAYRYDKKISPFRMVPLFVALVLMTPKLVSAQPYVDTCGTFSAPACALAQNAQYLYISGSGFSTTASDNTVQLLPAGSCAVTSATATSLTCQFIFAPNNGNLYATVFVSGSPSSLQLVATVQPPPAVFPQDTVVTGVSGGMVSFDIIGSDFDTANANTVTLVDSASTTYTGTFTAGSPTQIVVNVNSLSPTFNPVAGPISATVNSFGGVSSAQNVANRLAVNFNNANLASAATFLVSLPL